MWRGLACAVCALLALASAARGADTPNPSAVQELYLEVSLNAVVNPGVVRFLRSADGRLHIALSDVRALGIGAASAELQGEPEREVALDSIAGLTYTYDAAQQSIALHLSDALRDPLALAVRSARPFLPGVASRGVLLNYDVSLQTGSSGRSGALNEFRYFDANGAFSSSGLLRLHGNGRAYVRHDSSWNWAAPDALRALQVGDTVTRSLSWSRSLRIAGVEWRQNFALRPDLVTYPLADIAGSAVVPGSLSLYVNGMRQLQAEVPQGAYVLNGVGGVNGAGEATVVTRDALGRELISSLPLYVDTRLLAPGLSEYALAFGLPRRAYGERSFEYAGYPVASASLRHGLHPALTLEANAQASSQLINGGVGALVRLGQHGVVRGALAVSGGSRAGGLASVGYQYLSAAWSVDLEHLRTSAGYADLGSREGAPLQRATDRLTLYLRMAAAQNLSFSYAGYRLPDSTALRLASLAYGVRFGQHAYFSLTGWRDFAQSGGGVMAALSMSLPGRTSASLSAGQRAGARNWTAGMSRAADIDGGLGWSLQAGGQGAARYQFADVSYLGNSGRVSAQTQRSNGRARTSISLAGAVVAMDGSAFGARQVGRAFALVTTGMAGVPVLHENRLRGYTDAGGRLLVTDLVPYAPNALAIDTRDLPLDAWVAHSQLEVAPQQLAGALARFTVERRRAVSLLVQLPDGATVAAGTSVQIVGGTSTVVGHGGVVFLEPAQAQNRLVFDTEAGPCAVNVAVDTASSAALATIGPLRCSLISQER